MRNVIVRSALVLLVVAVFTGSLFAQRGEILERRIHLAGHDE